MLPPSDSFALPRAPDSGQSRGSIQAVAPPNRRTWLTLEPGNIPEALREGKRFVGWRSEARRGQPKPAKMPYSPNVTKGASSTAPGDWVSFDQAVSYAQAAGLDGIMRAFDP